MIDEALGADVVPYPSRPHDTIEELTGDWTLGELAQSFLLLAMAFGEDQKVRVDAGYNNVCLEIAE